MKKSAYMYWGLLIAISLFMGGCGDSDSSDSTSPSATYDITGTWAYTLLSSGTTLQAGTMTFIGTEVAGTFAVVNLSVEIDTGVYTVDDVTVTMVGSQEWSGTFSNESTISGTWQDSENSTSGTWIALKQS